MSVLISLLLLIVLPTLLLRVAALIWKANLSWLNAFILAFAMAVISILIRALVGSGIVPPLPTWGSAVVTGVIYFGLGAWWVGWRGSDKDGGRLGLRGGLAVMLLYVALSAALSLAGAAVVATLR